MTVLKPPGCPGTAEIDCHVPATPASLAKMQGIAGGCAVKDERIAFSLD
jgi:hypothetical protein